MILLNFSHPFSADQLEHLTRLTGKSIDRVINVSTQFDHSRPFAAQIRTLADEVPFSTDEWQGQAIVVNPPSLASIACLLIAELHGRMGHFPTIVRVMPLANSLLPTYEPAEILLLQSVRDSARKTR